MPVLTAMTAALALSGCSSDDDPGVAPSPSPVPTETPTPEPTITPEPTAEPTADPTDALEAEITAFFEEYAETINASWTSSEALEQRRKMFVETCRSCLAGYEIVKSAHAEELTFEGDFTTNIEVSLISWDDEIAAFLVISDTPAARLVDPDGSIVDRFDENLNRQVVYQATRAEGGTWILIKDEVL
jgi:hypothetical protein